MRGNLDFRSKFVSDKVFSTHLNCDVAFEFCTDWVVTKEQEEQLKNSQQVNSADYGLFSNYTKYETKGI